MAQHTIGATGASRPFWMEQAERTFIDRSKGEGAPRGRVFFACCAPCASVARFSAARFLRLVIVFEREKKLGHPFPFETPSPPGLGKVWLLADLFCPVGSMSGSRKFATPIHSNRRPSAGRRASCAPPVGSVVPRRHPCLGPGVSCSIGSPAVVGPSRSRGAARNALFPRASGGPL